MSDTHRPMPERSRQELLDEIYLLRDVAGEREQQSVALRAELADKDEMISDRDQAIAAMQAELELIYASRSWRLTTPLRKVTGWFTKRRPLDKDARGLSAGTQRLADASEAATHVAAPQRGMASINPSRHPVTPSGSAHSPTPCLFVDITELALRQGKTGVQRVTREILRELLVSSPAGYSVVPVIAPAGQPYRETVGFGLKELQGTTPLGLGPRMNGQAGDVFLGLDHAMDAVIENAGQLAAVREQGVRLWFVCNDTLPLAHPEWFTPDVQEAFERWFRTIASVGTGIVCISHATELDVQHWVKALEVQRAEPLAYGVFPLGADMPVDPYEAALSPAGQAAVDQIRRLPSSFLMVGTIEPRKGHLQALEAFNQLWSGGENVALVIVGHPGWMTEVTQRRIRHHEEFGKRLFWFMDANDALLDKLYGSCTTLLAASEGEGYGLPLVEALRHGLPVLCRDLPVFREVAGEAATYFSGNDPAELVIALRRRRMLRGQVCDPDTAGTVSRVRWSDSAQQLLAAIGCEARVARA